MSASLRLVTLGDLRVEREGVVVRELEPKRLLLAVLAYLVVEGRASRDRLLGLFWPERDPHRARHSLSQALYELRQHLGEAWVDVGSEHIRTTDAVCWDGDRFLLMAEEEGAGPALSVYGGPFLDDFYSGATGFEHWASGKRASLARQARRLYRAAVDKALASGDGGGALAFARRWVTTDPLDDEAQHRLIEILAARGERVEALRAYDTYRALLAEEKLWPLENTEALMERVRAGQQSELADDLRDPTSEPPSPAITDDTTRLRAGAPTPGSRLVRVVEGDAVEAYPVHGSRMAIGPAGPLPATGTAQAVAARLLVRTVRTAGGEEARYILRDEGAPDGVWIRVRGPWPLQPGDEVMAGRQRFRYEEGSG